MAKKLKTYKLKFWDDTYEVAPVIERYEMNGALAIELYELNGEDFGTLTVNLPFAVKPSAYDNFEFAFVDVNLFKEENLKKLINDKMGTFFEGYKAKSGFVDYPLVKFDLTKLNTEEDLEEYFKEKYNVELGGECNA